jgi:hypothetical protein
VSLLSLVIVLACICVIAFWKELFGKNRAIELDGRGRCETDE